MNEPRNLRAIQTWLDENRPDLTVGFQRLIEGPQADAYILIMTSCFEAGRMFQANEVADSTRYVPMEEAY